MDHRLHAGVDPLPVDPLPILILRHKVRKRPLHKEHVLGNHAHRIVLRKLVKHRRGRRGLLRGRLQGRLRPGALPVLAALHIVVQLRPGKDGLEAARKGHDAPQARRQGIEGGVQIAHNMQILGEHRAQVDAGIRQQRPDLLLHRDPKHPEQVLTRPVVHRPADVLARHRANPLIRKACGHPAGGRHAEKAPELLARHLELLNKPHNLADHRVALLKDRPNATGGLLHHKHGPLPAPPRRRDRLGGRGAQGQRDRAGASGLHNRGGGHLHGQRDRAGAFGLNHRGGRRLQGQRDRAGAPRLHHRGGRRLQGQRDRAGAPRLHHRRGGRLQNENLRLDAHLPRRLADEGEGWEALDPVRAERDEADGRVLHLPRDGVVPELVHQGLPLRARPLLGAKVGEHQRGQRVHRRVKHDVEGRHAHHAAPVHLARHRQHPRVEAVIAKHLHGLVEKERDVDEQAVLAVHGERPHAKVGVLEPRDQAPQQLVHLVGDGQAADVEEAAGRVRRLALPHPDELALHRHVDLEPPLLELGGQRARSVLAFVGGGVRRDEAPDLALERQDHGEVDGQLHAGQGQPRHAQHLHVVEGRAQLGRDHGLDPVVAHVRRREGPGHRVGDREERDKRVLLLARLPAEHGGERQADVAGVEGKRGLQREEQAAHAALVGAEEEGDMVPGLAHALQKVLAPIPRRGDDGKDRVVGRALAGLEQANDGLKRVEHAVHQARHQGLVPLQVGEKGLGVLAEPHETPRHIRVGHVEHALGGVLLQGPVHEIVGELELKNTRKIRISFGFWERNTMHAGACKFGSGVGSGEASLGRLVLE